MILPEVAFRQSSGTAIWNIARDTWMKHKRSLSEASCKTAVMSSGMANVLITADWGIEAGLVKLMIEECMVIVAKQAARGVCHVSVAQCVRL